MELVASYISYKVGRSEVISYMLKQLKTYKFFVQVKQEAKKVIWPDKKDLIASTLVVVFAVVLFSIVIMILDYGIHNLINFLLNIGKQP